MRALRIIALVFVSFAAVLLFLLGDLPALGGVCNANGACTTFNLPSVIEVVLFGLACAGIGMLAMWRVRS